MSLEYSNRIWIRYYVVGSFKDMATSYGKKVNCNNLAAAPEAFSWSLFMLIHMIMDHNTLSDCICNYVREDIKIANKA